jgi:anti-sigma B factor antagonist
MAARDTASDKIGATRTRDTIPLGSDLKWPLHVTPTRCDKVLVIVLSGRLGQAAETTLSDTVAHAIDQGDIRIVLDLADVDYISSPGLRAIASAADRCTARNGMLALCGVVEPVRIALELTGLAVQIPIEPTRELAVARLT